MFEVVIINPAKKHKAGWAEVRNGKSSHIVTYCMNDKPEDLIEKVIQSKRQRFINQILNLLKKVI